jgi:hypothetical protein
MGLPPDTDIPYRGRMGAESGAPVVTMVVDGQAMQGYENSKGDFWSLDGKWYKPAGGDPQQGITDPANNDFIQNGVIRYDNGTPEYGSVQDTIFFADNGKLEELPDGRWESGETVNNTFVATDKYDGQTLVGTYDNKDDFFLQSGLDEIPATGPQAGQEVAGITDPATGDFIPGGVFRTIDGVQYAGVVQDGIFYADNDTLAQILSTGLVIHGQTVNNAFLATMEYQGQTYQGYYDGAGDFFPQAGTFEITAGGTKETGITDPSNGDFIPGGVIRTIDGVQYYGVVQDGIFYADNDTLAQILSTGLVIHGQTVNNAFLATMEYQGQTYQGYYDGAGNFFSQDGTFEITAAGTKETGITDPSNGEFIQGGVAFTTANGTVLYGYMDGSDFYTYNYTEIVFNGTALTGTYNQNTGIFTASNGSSYFIGTDGIESATPQHDGSYKLPDGSIVMTPHAWKVDLPLFLDAVNLVQDHADSISLAVADIQAQFSVVESAWSSPAGASFPFVVEMVNTGVTVLDTMLTSIIERMRVSYLNYLTTEYQNNQNVSGTTSS